MNTNLKWALALLLISMLVVTACAPSSSPSDKNKTGEAAHSEDANTGRDEHAGDADADHDDGDDHDHFEIPAEYAGQSNPFTGDAGAAEAGKAVFQNGCASCHGSEGKGDGPAAAQLTPEPPDLTDSSMMNELSDAYLFWRISEGGAMEPFNSAMPIWKDALSADERWQIVTYLRTLSQ